jgi:hypothetical protein
LLASPCHAAAATRRASAASAVVDNWRPQDPKRRRWSAARTAMPGKWTPGSSPGHPLRHARKGFCRAAASVMPRALRARYCSVALSAPAAWTAHAAPVRLHCHESGVPARWPRTVATCLPSQSARCGTAVTGPRMSARMAEAASWQSGRRTAPPGTAVATGSGGLGRSRHRRSIRAMIAAQVSARGRDPPESVPRGAAVTLLAAAASPSAASTSMPSSVFSATPLGVGTGGVLLQWIHSPTTCLMDRRAKLGRPSAAAWPAARSG